MRLFNKVAIVGVGLIGGSAALAMRKHGLAEEIVGVSRHKASIARAKRMGVVDTGSTDLDSIKGADLIILATPVAHLIESLPRVFKLAKNGAIIIDVASTKGAVVAAANKLTSKNKIFIGCHPLAGSEKRGVANACPGLFKNSLCILTPSKIKNTAALTKVARMFQIMGARTMKLSAKNHDAILASVSHLPHAAAFCLMHAIPKQDLKFGAGGLKDTTRIASSDPQIWEEIFLTNREELLKSMDTFERSLGRLKALLKKKDVRALRAFLKSAKDRRDSIV